MIERDRFDDLVRQNLNPLRAFLAGRGVMPGMIDDMAQDVFVQALQHFERYDQTRPFRLWLFGIANNVIRSDFRKERYASRLRSRLAALPIQDSDFVEEWLDEEHQRVEIDRLRTCLGRLGKRARHLIALRFEENMSMAEIEAHANMKGSTVRMTLLRSRQSLRACLERQRAKASEP